MSTVRSFVALELSPHIVESLLGSGEALRSADVSWAHEKWVAETNLHVTLKFLGNVAKPDLTSLAAELATALADLDRFELRLSGLKAVPSLSRCSMVWASFMDDANAHCAALAGRVDETAALLGGEPEARAFKPHVTLVRARKPKRLTVEALTCANASLGPLPISMSVPSATLFASALTRQGPVYERLAELSLR